MVALLLASSALLLQTPQKPQPNQRTADKTVYTVSTAHLDTNWLWTIQTTIGDYLPKTMGVNFDFFQKYPDYVFNFEGAWRYMLIKEYYPEQYAKLKDYIRQGRWKVSGSWVDAVDTNIPSPESLIRQALYGNGFWKKEFGKTSEDVFLPDCFGFSYALPSIAAHTGLKGFSTQKLSWGSAAGIPFAVGAWQGVDGSTIVAALDPGSYGSTLPSNINSNPELVKRVEDLGKKSGVYADYRYHGTGDTGGGPSDESVKNLEKGIHSKGPLNIVSASSDQLFKDLTAEQVAKLPRYKGELLLTTHGTGCYTSQAVMKKWNRENELLADAAEREAVAADWLGGARYPSEKLEWSWVHFLWHQFHDDLTGTSIPAVYPFSWNDEVLCLSNFAEILKNSVAATAAAMDTRVQGVPLVVYNPLGSSRQDVVEATVDFGISPPTNIGVYGPDGKETPSQVVSRDGGRLAILFLASVGPVSTTVFDLRSTQTPCELNTGLSVSPSGLENSRYKVKIDDNGDVASVFDKKTNRELLKSPIRLELRDDYSPDWPSWEIKYPVEREGPRSYVAGPAEVKVVENGPARVALEITRKADGSTFVERVQLSAGDGSRVDVPTHVEWRSKGTLLKADFNVTSDNPNATYDLGLGTVARGNDTDKKYEVPAQKWADVTSRDGFYGVSVLTNCKYGWDKPSDDHLRLTLLHTARANGGYAFQETNDLGDHDFTYSIVGHSGDWTNETDWDAQRLNQPLRAFQTTAHAGELGKALSLVQADNPAVQIEALKKAENSNETIIRVFERTGKPVPSASLTFASPITHVREVNGVEDGTPQAGELTASGNRLQISLRPYQPRTFALTLGPPPTKVTMPVSHPVSLPYNLRVVTQRGEYSVYGFDDDNDAIPAEQFPKETVAEGVSFKFGPADGYNALQCSGQTIDLGSGNYNRVCILAAAGSDDVNSTFKVGPTNYAVVIPSFTGKIGQWFNRIVNGSYVRDPNEFGGPFIKRVPVGWMATHRHNRLGATDLYTYCYLFKYEFDVPPGVHTLTLPPNPAVKVMAVTAVESAAPMVRPTAHLYE